MTEEWRSVPGWAGYDVSNLGRVRSWWKRAAGRRFALGERPRVLKGGRSGDYPKVRMSNPIEGTWVMAYVHIVVLEAFVGPRPEGMEGCHNNGNAADASLTNLRWDTPAANQADKKLHGTQPAGDTHYRARLTRSDIDAMRTLTEAGMTQREVAERFAVTQSMVSRAIRGKTYRAWSGETVLRMLDRSGDARQGALL